MILRILAFLIAALAIPVMGATPISGLRLTTGADGGGQVFTNLVTTNLPSSIVTVGYLSSNVVITGYVPTNRLIIINGQTNNLASDAVFTIVTSSSLTNIVVNGVTGTVINGMSSVGLTSGDLGALSTNALPGLTNGFVTAGITNGLATTNQLNGYIPTNALPGLTNGFVGASITNGLATTGYVQNVVGGYVPTNDPIYIQSVTNIVVNGATGTVSGGIASVVFQISGVLVTNQEYSGTSITSDFSIAKSFRINLTNSPTLEMPSNVSDGQTVKWWLRQGVGGPYSLSLATAYVLPAGVSSLSLSTNEGCTDVLIGEYDSVSNVVHLTGLLLYSR